MADDVLEISTSIDISPITTGFDQLRESAAATFGAVTDAMSELMGRSEEITNTMGALVESGAEATDQTSSFATSQQEIAQQTGDANAALQDTSNNAGDVGDALEDADATLVPWIAHIKDLEASVRVLRASLDEARASIKQMEAAMASARDQAKDTSDGVKDAAGSFDASKAFAPAWEKMRGGAAGAAGEEVSSVVSTMTADADATKIYTDRLDALKSREKELTETTSRLSVAEKDRTKSSEQINAITAARIRAEAEHKNVLNQITVAETEGVTQSDIHTAAMRRAAEESRRLVHQQHEARYAAMMLGHEVGIVLPRHVVSFLASIGPVAAIMASAFSVVMVVGLIEALGKGLPKAINSAIEALIRLTTGTTRSIEEMKKHNDEVKRAIAELQRLDAEVRKLQRPAVTQLKIDLGTAEKDLERAKGAMRTAKFESDQLQESAKKFGESKGFLLDWADAYNKSLAPLSEGGSPVTKLFGPPGAFISGAFIAAIKGITEVTSEEVNKAADAAIAADIAVRDATLKVLEAKLKIYDKHTQEVISVYKAERDAAITIDQSKLSAFRVVSEQRRRLGQIGLEESLADARSAADKEYQIELQKIENKKKAIASEAPSKGKEETAAATVAVNAEEKALREKHVADMRKLDVDEIEKRRAFEFSVLDDEERIALSRIDTAKATNDALVRMNQMSTMEQLENARRLSAESFTTKIDVLVSKKESFEKTAKLTPEEIKTAETGAPGEKAFDDLMKKMPRDYATTLLAMRTLTDSYDAESLSSDAAIYSERNRVSDEKERASLSERKTYMEADFRAREELLRREVSERTVSAEKEAAIERDIARSRYELAVEEQNQRIKVASRSKDFTVEQEKAMRAELVALKTDYDAKIAAIDYNESERIRREAATRASIIRDYAEQDYAVARESADRKLSYGIITTAQWADLQNEALAKRRDAELAANDAILEGLRETLRTGTDEYAKAMRDRQAILIKYQHDAAAIHDKELEKWRQVTSAMSEGFTAGVHEWIIGQKTFHDAMVASWNNMVLSVVQHIERIATEWMAKHVFMAAMEKIFHIKVVADAAQEGAQKQAINAQTNLAITSQDAAAATARRTFKLGEIVYDRSVDLQKVTSHSLANATMRANDVLYSTTHHAFKMGEITFDRSMDLQKVISHRAANTMKQVSDSQTFALAHTLKGTQLAMDVSTDTASAMSRVTSNTVKMASDTATESLSASFHAARQARSLKEVFTAAKTAAAHAFKSVMEALPFPADVIVAPIVAATTFAAVMAFGAFEKGGLVKQDMVALVHANEMVLPAEISTSLRELISSGSKFEARDTTKGGVVESDTTASVSRSALILDAHMTEMIRELASFNRATETVPAAAAQVVSTPSISVTATGGAGGIGGAARGGLVRSDMTVSVHAQEMVLSADVSRGFEQLINQYTPASTVIGETNESINTSTVQLHRGDVVVAPGLVSALRDLRMTSVSSFAQGGIVGKDMLAQVHKDEMVLPVTISSALQSLIATGTRWESFATSGVVERDRTAALDRSSLVLGSTVTSALRELISAGRDSAALAERVSESSRTVASSAMTHASAPTVSVAGGLGGSASASAEAGASGSQVHSTKTMQIGGLVASDTVARLHESEMLIHKELAQLIRSTFNQPAPAAFINVSSTAGGIASAPEGFGALSDRYTREKEVSSTASDMQVLGAGGALVELKRSDVVLEPKLATAFRDLIHSVQPSFAGGGIVGRDQTATVHAGETILSKSVSSMLQSLFSTSWSAPEAGRETVTTRSGAVERESVERISSAALVMGSRVSNMMRELFGARASFSSATSTATKATLPSAATGGTVGRDMTVRVHESEMVMHPALAGAMQSLVSSISTGTVLDREGATNMVKLSSSDVVIEPALAREIRSQLGQVVVPAFAKGGIAEKSMFSMVHEKEMVLPGGIASGLTEMIRNSSTSTGANASTTKVNLTYSPTMIGADKSWVKKALRDNADEVITLIKKSMRNKGFPNV